MLSSLKNFFKQAFTAPYRKLTIILTGNESPSLVRKTFRQLMMQKSEVEGAKEEEENPPIVIKERTYLLWNL